MCSSTGVARFTLCLVMECKEIEDSFGTHFTNTILGGKAKKVSIKEVKKMIGQLDREKRIELCVGKAPQIAGEAKNRGRLRLWDMALDFRL